MKLFSILAMVFLASAPAVAKSLQDVVNTYSTVEVISPVEFNGNPVHPNSGPTICKLAGFSVMLESVEVKKSLKRGSKVVYIGYTSSIYAVPQEVMENLAFDVLESVTCAK